MLAYFNISIRINNLLVDFLLPALALAAFGSLSAEQASFRSRCLSVVPVLGLLVITKNTGIFFAALVYVFLLYRAVKLRNELEKPRPYVWLALAAIAASLLPLVLWNFHTALAFPGDTSKFSYDLGALTALKIDKTPEQIRAITSLFLKTAVSLSLRATQGILLFNALALAAYVIARFALKKRWKLLKVLLALDIALVLYYAGILGMYIVSMPLEEALRLRVRPLCFQHGAAVYRRAFHVRRERRGAVVLYSAGRAAGCAGVQEPDEQKHLSGGDGRSHAGGGNGAGFRIQRHEQHQGGVRHDPAGKVEAMVGDNWTREDDSTRYLFYATDTNEQVSNYYLPYVGRYFLFASQVDAVSAFDEAAFMGQIQTYDKFVILESTPEISAYMQAHAGLPGEPGIYIVKDTFPEAVIP